MYQLKKYLISVLLLLLSFCACGNTQEPSDSGTQAAGAPSLSEIQADIISSLKVGDHTEIDAERLLNLYGIEENDFTQSACFVTTSGAFPHEVIMLEAADEDAAAKIAEKLQNRLTEVQNQYKDYDAESYALAQECSVNTDGLLVSLFLSPEHEAMREVLTAALK